VHHETAYFNVSVTKTVKIGCTFEEKTKTITRMKTLFFFLIDTGANDASDTLNLRIAATSTHSTLTHSHILRKRRNKSTQ